MKNATRNKGQFNNNPKCLCNNVTEPQSIQVLEAKIDRTERRSKKKKTETQNYS